MRKRFGKSSGDSHLLHEMVLWAENTEPLYRVQQAWSKNFAMKMRRGVFNRSLAVKGIANNFVPMITRSYRKKFGRNSVPSISLTDKRKIASKLLPSIIEDAKDKLKNMKPLKRKKR